MRSWQPLAAGLADHLAASGVLSDVGWYRAFATIPRHLFVPRFIDGQTEISRADGDEWLQAVYADEALLTAQRPTPTDAGALPTSSSSQPTIMAIMLDRIAARPGMRVLEIGTGTGYNTALLCHRLGQDAVTSIDIDPDLIRTSADRLAQLDYHPILTTGDGYAGYRPGAPYDAIIATCAINHIPPAWVQHLALGGRIVAPLVGDAGALAVLDKTAHNEVTGRIDTALAHFMPLRPDADNPLAPGESLAHTADGMAHHGTTALDPAILANPDSDLVCWLQLHLRALRLTQPDNTGLTLHTATSYACVGPQSDGGRWPVEQRGPHRIFDTVEAAIATWNLLDHPTRSRLGLSALDNRDRQYIWLDQPDSPYSWPLPL